MNKLGIFAALGLCFTVGGVYATWNYATSNATNDTESEIVVLAEVEEQGSKGTIAITNNLTMTIDDTNGDYKAELVIAGSLNITYTPNDGAEATIDMECVITCPTSTYNSVAVFTLDADTLTSSGKVATWTISASDLSDVINLADISLPTMADYEDFKAEVMDGDPTFVFTVSEKA